MVRVDVDRPRVASVFCDDRQRNWRIGYQSPTTSGKEAEQQLVDPVHRKRTRNGGAALGGGGLGVTAVNRRFVGLPSRPKHERRRRWKKAPTMQVGIGALKRSNECTVTIDEPIEQRVVRGCREEWHRLLVGRHPFGSRRHMPCRPPVDATLVT